MPTKEPVRGSGWYERLDGSVTRYDWQGGRLIEGATVASWAEVPDREPWRDDPLAETECLSD